MPNQPQATIARINAAMLEPMVPNDARNRMGKGMPYFVPACALSTIGTKTNTLARMMVNIACCQLIPALIKPAASMYVGMHTAMPIHKEAIFHIDHLRCSRVVGARSSLYKSE